jgi:hypothetical protein
LYQAKANIIVTATTAPRTPPTIPTTGTDEDEFVDVGGRDIPGSELFEVRVGFGDWPDIDSDDAERR